MSRTAVSTIILLFTAVLFICGTGCTTAGGGPGESGPVEIGGDEEGLVVAAVQLHIDESTYSSVDVFEETMRDSLEEVCADADPDLVVFPEYTSVFLAIEEYVPLIDGADTLQEGIELVRRVRPDAAGPDLNRLFLSEAAELELQLDAVWGELAREFDVCIAAGTYFRRIEEGAGNPALRNTLVVYDRDGSRMYEQDKVFLTEFEETLLKITPGEVSDARPLRVGNYEAAFTICRDSFFSCWEEGFQDADVWISIKANGESFDRDARNTFAEALPERIAGSGVPYGMVVCLTGSFLDLFWEGESSIMRHSGDSVEITARSRTPWSEDLLVLSIP